MSLDSIAKAKAKATAPRVHKAYGLRLNPLLACLRPPPPTLTVTA